MGVPDAAKINMEDLERGVGSSGNDNQQATPNASRSEYRDKFITPKLLQRPWLDILDEFMDPNKDCFAVPTDHRMSFFDIEVIHISVSGEVSPPIKCKNPEQFKKAISNGGQERSSTLVMAEDLSRAMINALGMEYDLEPEFFALHLRGTESFRMGKWQASNVRSPTTLPDRLREAPYYEVSFRRPYHFPGGLEEIIELRSSETSTPRGAQILREDLTDAFVFEKISVYKKKGSNTGIILTDKLLSEDPPAPYVLEPINLLDYEVDASDPKGRRYQVSSRKQLVGWLEQLPPEEAKALVDDHEPLALRPVLKIIERAGKMFFAHASYTMSRIVTRHCDERFPDSISFALDVSRSLHRYIHNQQELLKSSLRLASLRGAGNFADQIQDIKFLIEDMEGALKALKEDVRFLVSAASIKEGQLVTWVSKFAFLFLPVTTVATILSISDSGYTRFAILGGLAVPFVLISVFVMFFWRPSHVDSLSL